MNLKEQHSKIYKHHRGIQGGTEESSKLHEEISMDFAKTDSINFLKFAANNGWYRNRKIDEWYQLTRTNYNRTTEELYQL